VTNANQRTVAVTGAGGGLGRDIALGLAAKNYRVFGTAFRSEEIEDLKRASSGAVTLAVCDITDAAAVKSWAGEVATHTGGSLDLLINNAGILTPGPLEILPLDAIRHEFEVNVFGALSVMNAFLPALRKAHGRIVQISTWTASLPLPFNGPSGASKAATEVFAAVYRAELKHLGVDVVIAPAGNMRTGGPAKTAAALARVADGMTPEQRELYGQTFCWQPSCAITSLSHQAEVFVFCNRLQILMTRYRRSRSASAIMVTFRGERRAEPTNLHQRRTLYAHLYLAIGCWGEASLRTG